MGKIETDFIATSLSLGRFMLRRTALVMLLSLATVTMRPSTSRGQDLAADTSWQSPGLDDVRGQLKEWADSSNLPDAGRTRLAGWLASISDEPRSQSVEWVDLILDAIALARPDVAELRQRLIESRPSDPTVSLDVLLGNPDEQGLVKDHFRLWYGRWLTRGRLYDEAFAELSLLDPDQSLDPATLLFYRGIAEHQLLRRDECIATMKQLLENESQLPRRFAVLSRMMLADIEDVKPDSLDEIARLMEDVGRRTGLYRSGQRVRDQEQEVVDKLEKLIDKLEKQRQQQQASAGQSGGGAGGPGKPLDESQRAGGKGSGDVRSRSQIDGGQWGDLPPERRAAALAEMARDMPPHYRAVIEEYFRQLARENETP